MVMPSLTPVVRALIKLNAIIFVVLLVLDVIPATQGFAEGALVWGGITPRLWIDWFPFVPFWQLLSWGFLHSLVNPQHILMNMLFLFFLGTMLEGLIGSRRFLVTYMGGLLLSGVGTLVLGLGQELLVEGPLPDLAWYQMNHTIGASGAVFTVVVAMATLRPRTQMIFIIIPMTLKVLAIIYVGLDLFGLLRDIAGDGGNVANFAHLVGAGWGFAVVRTGFIYRDPLEALQNKQAQRSAQREQDDKTRLDELLTRIHKQGIGTLSRAEREFMKRVSKRD